ncbi:MAG: 50S ribosomal protein L25 [Planctomycetes bacterium]|nr:50S ribosomal protein L25 [Planctomycetota bacterium]
MAAQELTAEVRTEKGTRPMRRLRATGKIPAVLYSGGKEGTAIVIEGRVMTKILTSGSHVVTIKLGGQDKQALIKDVQYDALGEQILHADFNELKAGQKVRVNIPVGVKGIPKGHADGGVLIHVLHQVVVECLPTAIPEKFVLDVEPLAMGQALHVSDLKLPEGVTALSKGTEVIAACTEPRKEEVAATPAEGALLEPEVIAEKKEEPAEGAAAGDEKKPAGGEKKAEAKKPEAKK